MFFNFVIDNAYATSTHYTFYLLRELISTRGSLRTLCVYNNLRIPFVYLNLLLPLKLILFFLFIFNKIKLAHYRACRVRSIALNVQCYCTAPPKKKYIERFANVEYLTFTKWLEYERTNKNIRRRTVHRKSLIIVEKNPNSGQLLRRRIRKAQLHVITTPKK